MSEDEENSDAEADDVGDDGIQINEEKMRETINEEVTKKPKEVKKDKKKERGKKKAHNETKGKKRKSIDPLCLASSISWAPQIKNDSNQDTSLTHKNDQANKIIVSVKTNELFNAQKDLYLKIVCNMAEGTTIKGTNPIRKHPSGKQCIVPLSHFGKIHRRLNSKMDTEVKTVAVELHRPIWILEGVMRANADEKVNGRSLSSLMRSGQYKMYLALKTKDGGFKVDQEPLDKYWRKDQIKEPTTKKRRIEFEEETNLGDLSKESTETETGTNNNEDPNSLKGSNECEGLVPISSNIDPQVVESPGTNPINSSGNRVEQSSIGDPPCVEQENYSVGYQIGYATATGMEYSKAITEYKDGLGGEASEAFLLGFQEGQKQVRGGEYVSSDGIAGEGMGLVASKLSNVARSDNQSNYNEEPSRV
eukprot:TRINITY_DN2537_c0_g1_i1.p1 TRINITY_DN2537_c0_g1~~TRINITY_DN2537_c0_g1_i1.p1  ORF type:complete len:455 (-),score=86.76 TRINITY_DN2537_c0_g1_i1:236-1495(-)